jgi:hypothetical protein
LVQQNTTAYSSSMQVGGVLRYKSGPREKTPNQKTPDGTPVL